MANEVDIRLLERERHMTILGLGGAFSLPIKAVILNPSPAFPF